MSNKKLIKSTSSVRSRKFPPPLNLPSIPNEHNTSEQNSSINDYSCSSFPCSHQSISYTLPTCQRPQIFQRLQDSSSSLLVTPSRRSQSLKISNQLKQRQTGNVPDQQWIDCICLIISKSLKNEIEALLDKYKTNYFDRINASDTSDEIIRTSLCEMVAQLLSRTGKKKNRKEQNVWTPAPGLEPGLFGWLCSK
ncbi:unnamed protein product [Adineta ricciae]|uniref:Uncharacterized protein n=1 Tax=Adineta ricciae TaxID=249248 RepID=A0A815GBI9_ADIRI|nr:unnamed protein product [Adineta ricciae]